MYIKTDFEVGGNKKRTSKFGIFYEIRGLNFLQRAPKVSRPAVDTVGYMQT
jgi:hypothetical protein